MENSSKPLISVIMPVYNAEKFLREAVGSILDQTLSDVELIAIDDGSSDSSPEILESFRKKDPRLIIHRNPSNQGMPASLNTGLALARGKYIARMDADDISLPERFEKQVAFLETHPEIDIVGTALKMVDERGKTIGGLSAPREDLAIRWANIFTAAFWHATIMLRRSNIVDHKIQYNASREVSELDFFARLLENAHGANLAESLYIYRIHSGSNVSRFRRGNVDRKSKTIFANLQKRFPELSISLEQVMQVSGALAGRPAMFWKRAEAADTYLQVWQAFSERRTPDPDFYRIQRSVVLTAAKLALYPPFQPGSLKVVRMIFKIEPKWFLSFLRKFPGMVSTKIQTIIFRRNRK
jgi:glycosyltransferase involved in cell wall biosynthesis